MEVGQLVTWEISGMVRKGIFMREIEGGLAEIQCLEVGGRRMVIRTTVEISLLCICK